MTFYLCWNQQPFRTRMYNMRIGSTVVLMVPFLTIKANLLLEILNFECKLPAPVLSLLTPTHPRILLLPTEMPNHQLIRLSSFNKLQTFLFPYCQPRNSHTTPKIMYVYIYHLPAFTHIHIHKHVRAYACISLTT